MIIKWNIVEGIIEDVTLLNDFDQPCTEAHITFQTEDNAEHECVFTIGYYGDLHKKVPVFYSTKDANKCMVYLEDSQ